MEYSEIAELEHQIATVEELIEKYERRVPTEEQDPEQLLMMNDELDYFKQRMNELKKQ